MDANGNPQLVPGQHNIIDVVPGNPGYSDLWVVNLVMVPAGYVANTIKSVDDIQKSGYQVKQTSMLVDCPVVPLNSKLAEPIRPVVALTRLKGGTKVRKYSTSTSGPAQISRYLSTLSLQGMDANGNPQLVPGQHNIIDVLPGTQGYSPFWDVNLVIVPTSYQANSITSAAQVKASGFQVIEPGKVVNCPVVRTDDAVTGNTGPVMAGTSAMVPSPGLQRRGCRTPVPPRRWSRT